MNRGGHKAEVRHSFHGKTPDANTHTRARVRAHTHTHTHTHTYTHTHTHMHTHAHTLHAYIITGYGEYQVCVYCEYFHLIKYHALVEFIKPQRKDAKGNDTVVLSDWWRFNSGELLHFAFVLRALLTNAPNSFPPERLFSMFNASYGEDQQRSFGDYLELAMQSQYNKRNV